MDRKLGGLVLGVLLLSGCRTATVEWVAAGGSKADATVKLTHRLSNVRDVQADKQQALDLATQRCLAWGYSGAVPFGSQSVVCNASNQFGCTARSVAVEFQCTGQTH